MGGVITNTVQDRGARCQSSVVPPLPDGDGGVTDRATRGACSAGSGIVYSHTSYSVNFSTHTGMSALLSRSGLVPSPTAAARCLFAYALNRGVLAPLCLETAVAVWSRSMPPAQTSRSDCAASAVSVSRLTDRRRQRGPSAGAAAHAARHLSSKIRTPGASLGVGSFN